MENRRVPKPTPESLRKLAGQMLERLRVTRPLVCHVTNLVVMNWTANVTLAIGASPVMSAAAPDATELAAAASAVVLNMGTLDGMQTDLMLQVARTARQNDVPVVFDPVGLGGTAYRTTQGRLLLNEAQPAVVRGNPGEIAALAGRKDGVFGVDSRLSGDLAPRQMARLALRLETVLVATGSTDLVSDGKLVVSVSGGHPLLAAVTGTGCGATTAVACFMAVAPDDPVAAAAAALAWYGLAAERAGAQSKGPGGLSWRFLDELYGLDPEDAKLLRFDVDETT